MRILFNKFHRSTDLAALLFNNQSPRKKLFIQNLGIASLECNYQFLLRKAKSWVMWRKISQQNNFDDTFVWQFGVKGKFCILRNSKYSNTESLGYLPYRSWLWKVKTSVKPWVLFSKFQKFYILKIPKYGILRTPQIQLLKVNSLKEIKPILL
jgi:hypothetical protein